MLDRLRPILCSLGLMAPLKVPFPFRIFRHSKTLPLASYNESLLLHRLTARPGAEENPFSWYIRKLEVIKAFGKTQHEALRLHVSHTPAHDDQTHYLTIERTKGHHNVTHKAESSADEGSPHFPDKEGFRRGVVSRPGVSRLSVESSAHRLSPFQPAIDTVGYSSYHPWSGRAVGTINLLEPPGSQTTLKNKPCTVPVKPSRRDHLYLYEAIGLANACSDSCGDYHLVNSNCYSLAGTFACAVCGFLEIEDGSARDPGALSGCSDIPVFRREKDMGRYSFFELSNMPTKETLQHIINLSEPDRRTIRDLVISVQRAEDQARAREEQDEVPLEDDLD